MNAFTIENPNPEDHLETEWLLTNGLGGYAMGTVLGVNTRRYHGLLVAATNPPVGRVVVLHSMIEQLIIPREDGTEDVIDLSTQVFLDGEGKPMLHPEGWKRLKLVEFAPERFIRWVFEGSAFIVERRVQFSDPYAKFTLEYTIDAPEMSRLRIRPLVSGRSFHSLNRTVSVERTNRTGYEVVLRTPHHDVGFRAMPAWVWRDMPQTWRRFTYPKETERGVEDVEDLASMGYFETDEPTSYMSVESVLADRAQACFHPRCPVEKYLFHRPADVGLRHLMRASTSYIVARRIDSSDHASILAGYPWFADWGRDAMIALPGLLLCTERFDEARSVLETFAKHIQHGLIPNRFADNPDQQPEYNTVDASLWFIYAVWQYLRAAGIPPSPLGRGAGGEGSSSLIDACRTIIRAYRAGIRVDDDHHNHHFDIRMDDADSLITAGDESTQLTWMDAKRDGVVFTPRHGKPVEINALWFNALNCLADMTDDDAEARDLRDLAMRACESFRQLFWWRERNCLRDVLRPSPVPGGGRGVGDEGSAGGRRVGGGGGECSWTPDHQLRPNQIFAVSLPHSPLAREQQRAVVDIVRDRLLTPFGLRTLDRDDPDYCPRYEGDMMSRDRAYHNGTVWPWLIGPFCEAFLRINDFSDESKHDVRAMLQPLLDEMMRTTGRTCLGQIAEVYDGDEPHTPDGCPAQAWSVAEVLRVLRCVEPLNDPQ